MDLFTPTDSRPVHFVGIGGAGMSALALIARRRGVDVSGCDTDPSGIAGGRVSAWGGNARLGSDDLFVVEADEYDQAFLTLHPTVAIVNNVEPDHLECYGSMAALEDAFVEFAGRAETAVVSADDAGARLVAGRLGRGVRRFGLAEDADVRIADVAQHADRPEATARLRDGRTLRLRLRVPGVHNLRNAVAALAATDA